MLPKPERWQGYLASATFVNEYRDFHFTAVAPGSNAPFWSLSFEATYYVVADLLLFAPRLPALIGAALLLGLAGPALIALLPLWALGFWLYRQPTLRVPRGVDALLLTVGSWRDRLPDLNFGFHLKWNVHDFNRSLNADYAVGLLFAIQLVCARQLLARTRLGPRLMGWLRWLGTLTFPMYCLHFPLLCMLRAMSPWTANSLANLALEAAGALGAIMLLTPVCELLRRRIRSRFATWLPEPTAGTLVPAATAAPPARAG